MMDVPPQSSVLSPQSSLGLDLTKYRAVLDRPALVFQGRVSQVIGLSMEVEGLRLGVGDVCTIHPDPTTNWISAEVVGFRENRLIVTPFSDIQGVRPGCPVFPRTRGFTVPVGSRLLGRIVDGLARPIDGKGPLATNEHYPVAGRPPDPLSRMPIRQPMVTGIRAVDGALTCGMGQRVGIFAGSGVGKSTLLGMIGRSARSDVNIIALVGERGREVQEFIENDLGPGGLERSVVVVATADQPALQRIKAAWVATAMAEYFRDRGQQVILLMDSVTRWAMALREVGLTVGEPPVVKGYPPSVFALIPKLLERAGTSHRGTVTGFYTVLVEGDDLTEPISDAVRSILDGHVWLSRKLAHENQYPAVDLLQSVSRLMPALAAPEHLRAANLLRDTLATYHASEDLINVGAYVTGSNSALDRALALMPRIKEFICQPGTETTPYEETLNRLLSLFPVEGEYADL